MFKKMCLMGICLWAGVALAETCANGHGTLIIGNDGVSKYCMSQVTMNWWSAFAWCDAAKGKLLNVTTECDKVEVTEEVWCANLVDKVDTYIWTANIARDGTPYRYARDRRSLGYGFNKNDGNYMRALCTLP